MVDRIESFTVTIPAGTAIATPVTVPTSFPDGVVVQIETRIPSGPSGLMGFAFQHSSQQIIPRTDGEWILGDDDYFTWPLQNYPTGNKWSVLGYNLDVYDHSFYLRYLVNELTIAQAQQIQIQPIG